jgi:hypothetical protein
MSRTTFKVEMVERLIDRSMSSFLYSWCRGGRKILVYLAQGGCIIKKSLDECFLKMLSRRGEIRRINKQPNGPNE